jgi:uncharacterized cupredoxin-like copper-binding protein
MHVRHLALATAAFGLLTISVALGFSATTAAPVEQGAVPTEIYVDQVDTAFLPREIVVRRNEPTRFVLANVAPSRNHGFVVQGLGYQWASTINPAGTSSTLDVTFTETGTYQFWCDVGSHRDQGMVGVLTVVPDVDTPNPVTRVDLSEFSVQPVMASTVAGDTRFELRNVGGFGHDLVVQGQGVQLGSPLVAAGDTVFWDVTLSTPGTYEIYCSVVVGAFDHRDLGMTGLLEVFPAANRM